MSLAEPQMKMNNRIKRIIAELVDACRENHVDELKLPALVDTYLEGDRLTVNEDGNTIVLANYLIDNGIADCVQRRSIEQIMGTKGDFIVVSQLECIIKDRKKLVELYSIVERGVAESISASFNVTGDLVIGGNRVTFQSQTPAFELLTLIMRDLESREAIWSYTDSGFDTLFDQVNHPNGDQDKISEHYRQLGYSINKRVKKKIPEIQKFLIVTSHNLRLNPLFV